MYYIVDMNYIPEELLEEINNYLSHTRRDFLYINKEDLTLMKGFAAVEGECTYIDIEKLKELLVLKRIQE